MTVTELVTAARNKYNAIGDSLWSDAELYFLFYEACQELAVETEVIQGKDASTSTVSGTQAYNYPSLFLSVKRLEYDGNKLFKVDDRDADALSLYNSAVTVTGQPQHYRIWNDQVYLIPTPNDAKVLTFYGYKSHAAIVVGTTIAIPTVFHMDLVNYVVSEMCAKDEESEFASYYFDKWEKAKLKIKRWVAKRKRGDSFASVKDEESMPVSLIGAR